MVNISVSPHIRDRRTTASVMRDVAIALAPALLMGVFMFGWRALEVILISAATCVLTEFVYQKAMKLPVTVGDYSALVTGLILAVNLPSTVPFWVPVLGGVFAILLVKQVFGGLGQNIMNPALAARCFLIISFPALMGAGFPEVANNLLGVDVISGATPLQILKDGGSVDLLKLFFGFHSGCIGETSALAILLGFVYMVARGVITPRIPAVYVGSTVALIALFRVIRGEPVTGEYLLGQAMGGGLLAGAVFMATDYVTSPVTVGGQWIYGVLLGLLTALFRVFGASAEGVSYAIIISNTLVPLIERITIPRPFGVPRQKKGGAAK